MKIFLLEFCKFILSIIFLLLLPKLGFTSMDVGLLSYHYKLIILFLYLYFGVSIYLIITNKINSCIKKEDIFKDNSLSNPLVQYKYLIIISSLLFSVALFYFFLNIYTVGSVHGIIPHPWQIFITCSLSTYLTANTERLVYLGNFINQSYEKKSIFLFIKSELNDLTKLIKINKKKISFFLIFLVSLFMCIYYYAINSQGYHFIESSVKRNSQIALLIGHVNSVKPNFLGHFYSERNVNNDTDVYMTVSIIGDRGKCDVSVLATKRDKLWQMRKMEINHK